MDITAIKKFIEDFIESEFKCDYATWDINVTNEQYNILKDKAYSFMHSTQPNEFSRAGVLEGLQKSAKERSFALIKLKKIIPRILFQIKHYESPVLGNALQPIVGENAIFACYVSYPSSGGRSLYFSSIFYVAETNEGLKIIYRKSFNPDTAIWYHPIDIAAWTVIENGKLIETQKYQAPEEATSLADYNNN